TGHLEHLGRQVDSVEPGDAAGAQPGPRPARSASEVGRVPDRAPRHRPERREQDEIHFVFNRRLVRRLPLAVALAYGNGWVATPVEGGKLAHDRIVPSLPRRGPP